MNDWLQRIGVWSAKGRKKEGAEETGMGVHVHPMSREEVFFPILFQKFKHDVTMNLW